MPVPTPPDPFAWFHRGFLAQVALTERDALAPLLDEPAWSLVTSLRLVRVEGERELLRAIGPRLTRLRTLEAGRSEGLRFLRPARPLKLLHVDQFFDWFPLDGLIDAKTWLDLNFVALIYVRREPGRVMLSPSGRQVNIVRPVTEVLKAVVRPDDVVTFQYTLSGRHPQLVEEALREIPHRAFEPVQLMAIG